MTDTYLTISESGTSLYTELRSRFMGFAHHVETEEDVKRILADYKKQYYDARHICYAYTLGPEAERTRQNDDGEPAGTAGAPLARALRSLSLTDTLIIVVRYFGGVKLGTSRLGVAYKTAAADALAAATVEERIITAKIAVSVPYPDADLAMRYVREAKAEITAREYTPTDTVLTIAVRLSDVEALRERLSKILSLSFLDNAETAL